MLLFVCGTMKDTYISEDETMVYGEEEEHGGKIYKEAKSIGYYCIA